MLSVEAGSVCSSDWLDPPVELWMFEEDAVVVSDLSLTLIILTSIRVSLRQSVRRVSVYTPKWKRRENSGGLLNI